MSGYRHQLTDVNDRWAIVAYIRALQRSQDAQVSFYVKPPPPPQHPSFPRANNRRRMERKHLLASLAKLRRRRLIIKGDRRSRRCAGCRGHQAWGRASTQRPRKEIRKIDGTRKQIRRSA